MGKKEKFTIKNAKEKCAVKSHFSLEKPRNNMKNNERDVIFAIKKRKKRTKCSFKSHNSPWKNQKINLANNFFHFSLIKSHLAASVCRQWSSAEQKQQFHAVTFDWCGHSVLLLQAMTIIKFVVRWKNNNHGQAAAINEVRNELALECFGEVGGNV